MAMTAHLTRIQITGLESSDPVECHNANGVGNAWANCAANDYVSATDKLRFTPATNSNDDVTFQFKVHDGTGYSASAYTFTISVSAVNDAPTWSASAADVTTDEDVAKAITGSTIADVDDTSLDSMTITSTESGTFSLASVSGLTFATGDGTADNQMTFSGPIANINTAIATITWTSQANNNNNAVLSLTANDGDDDSATDQVSITVNAVNDAPTSAGDSASVTEDVAYVGWTASSDWGYSDTEGSAMTKIKLASLPSNGALTDDDENACATQGTAACEVNDEIAIANLDDLFYTTSSNSVAADSFTFYVHDGTTWSASAATMTISVTPVNDAPTVANAQADFNAAEDAALNYQFNTNVFTDVDSGDSCTYTSTLQNGNALPGWITFTASTRTYSGTPANGDVGTVAVRTTCTDGSGAAANDDFTITVTNTNDAPSNAGDTATASEDVAYAGWGAAGDWGYSDVDAGDSMTAIKIVTLPSQGTLTETNNACGGDGCAADDVVAIAELAAGDLKYTGNSNYNGQDTFTYQVYDGEAYSSTGTMTITINAVNDAPVAGDTSDQTVYEDVAFSFQTTASTDVDGDTLSHTCVETGTDMPGFMSETADTGGRATLAGTAAASDLTGDADGGNTYAMTCTVSDGTATATDTFVITVTAINDAPYLSGDSGGAVDASICSRRFGLSVSL